MKKLKYVPENERNRCFEGKKEETNLKWLTQDSTHGSSEECQSGTDPAD